MLTIYRAVLATNQTPSLEERLLVQLLVTDTDDATLDATRRLMQPPVNWEKLIALTMDHRVSAIVYLRLQACFEPFVPPNVLTELETLYHAQQWYNLYTLSDMVKTLRLLEVNGIPALPFKGPAVAFTLYENPYMRRYKDVDVLIHKRDLERAKELLLNDGYQLADWVEEPAKISSNRFYDTQHITLVRTQVSFPAAVAQLELHWSVATSFDAFEQDADRFWGRTQPFPMGDVQFLGLPPDETLILLCMHGAKHLWSGLHWVYDIAQFVRHYPDFDWDGLLAETRKRRVKRLVHVSLLIAHRLTHVALPSAVRRLEVDPITDLLVRFNIGLIFTPNHPDTLHRQFRIILFHALLRETWRDQLTYCIYVIQHRRSTAARRLLLGVIVVIIALFFLIFRGG